jgi:hypothetical protein
LFGLYECRIIDLGSTAALIGGFLASRLASILRVASMMEITIQVPDELGRQLQRYQERLPELLARGLHEVMAESSPPFPDENAVIELLASRPTPEQVLALRPSPALQERISDLLDRNKDGTLTEQEQAELDRYQLLEHLVRLAKASAIQQLARTA